jgi:hypothetical protein
MMHIGKCSLCGEWTIVHGNNDRGIFLCDDCCPCYNHCPPVGEYFEAGKYYHLNMVEHWVRMSMLDLFRLQEKEFETLVITQAHSLKNGDTLTVTFSMKYHKSDSGEWIPEKIEIGEAIAKRPLRNYK